jgi:putative sugar O-methyltransferase
MIFSIDKAAKNRVSNVDSDEIFERIIAAYNNAKAIQADEPAAYQVGYLWLPVYERYMSEVMEALSCSNLSQLKYIYNNFFRKSCSSGLHGLHLDVEQHFDGDEIHSDIRERFFHDSLHRLNLWIELTEQRIPFEALVSNDIGNPYGFTLDDRFIRCGSDYHHYYATIINRLIRDPSRQTVTEIGGGFGGMAYFLMRDNHEVTYIDFDLPENLALASFYLLSSFPDRKIALFGEFNIERDDFTEYDAVLLPNFAIKHMKDDISDLTFNSYSLAEMSIETINEYFLHINRFTSKFIFHVNHNKVTQMNAHQFGVNQSKFEMLYRAPALWNLGRDKDMDEFEFLYKRKAMVFTTTE